MKLLYQREPIFISGLRYKLGSVRRTLDEVKASGRLAGSVETLSAMGYRYRLELAEGETLVDLAIDPLRSAPSALPARVRWLRSIATQNARSCPANRATL